MTSHKALEIWTVYDHPKDYPHHFVARKFLYDQPTSDVAVAPDLKTLRRHFQRWGLYCLPRQPGDDPKIVETWL